MLFAYVVLCTYLLALLTDNSVGQTMWTRIGLLLHWTTLFDQASAGDMSGWLVIDVLEDHENNFSRDKFEQYVSYI